MIKTSKDILVVDDEPDYCHIVQRQLKSAGFHAVLARDAQEALMALWENEEIGLVLLDVRLPLINGLNIYEIIRKDFPDKRVIVTSVLQKDEQQFLFFDADNYYNKSEDLSALTEKIQQALSSAAGPINKDEKRTYRRVPVNVLATCRRDNREAGRNGPHFISYTKDLSLKGGKFIVSGDVAVGQQFTIALELPVNFLPLLIDCEVRWVKKTEDAAVSKKNIEAGVRFVRLESARDEEKLKNYLSYV